MALKAIRDTFAYEPISPDTEVRRFVKAGDILLPHWTKVPEEDVIEDSTSRPLIIGNPAASTPEGQAPEKRRVPVKK